MADIPRGGHVRLEYSVAKLITGEEPREIGGAPNVATSGRIAVRIGWHGGHECGPDRTGPRLLSKPAGPSIEARRREIHGAPAAECDDETADVLAERGGGQRHRSCAMSAISSSFTCNKSPHRHQAATFVNARGTRSPLGSMPSSNECRSI